MARKPKLDVDLIRSAAASRWPEIISVLGGVGLDILDGRHHPCPKCGGRDRFRLLDGQAGALICNQCFDKKNGDGFAALQWLTGQDFLEVAASVGDYLGVKSQSKSVDPAKNLEFLDWCQPLVEHWCRQKPPIKPESIQAIGGRLARYRGQFTVVALPVITSAGKTCGWTLYNITGGLLPKYSKDGETEWVKVKLTHGSKPGLMGTVDRLEESRKGLGKIPEAWKTEGPTDVLSLLSVAPDIKAVCNANGAGEKPAALAERFGGCEHVNLVHDCDRPGQEGASTWCLGIVKHVDDVRNVILPFPMAETHGKDLRDFLVDHTFEELEQLAAAATPVDANSVDIIECDKDPHRLARINLEKYGRLGRTLRFYREEWYKWDGTRYLKIGKSELRAKLTANIREDFVQKYRESIGTADEQKHPEPVTRALVNDTMAAMESTQVVSGSVDMPCWVDGDREKKDWVALENGVLDVHRLLDGREDFMRSHDERWFSLSCLPFSFNPDASCETWTRTINHNLDGDIERINLLQEWAGYLLLPETGQQKFLILEGEGANGKSVYCAGIEGMLGAQNVSGVSLESFGDRFSKTETLGKLANIIDDVGELDKVSEGHLKSYVGGKSMFFDRKGLPGITKIPTARLMIACNNRPRIADKSDGIWRRMIVVPWLTQIDEKDQVQNMDKAWWWEQKGELPGIFNWALCGLARLRQQGNRFSRSALADEALKDYRLDANPAREFLFDSYEKSHRESHSFADEMYSEYKEWCRANGYSPLGQRNFGREIRRAFPFCERLKRQKTTTERTWAYIGVSKNGLASSSF